MMGKSSYQTYAQFGLYQNNNLFRKDWLNIYLRHIFKNLSSLFKRAATFGECSLLGKVFTSVALVTVLVVD